MKRVFVTWFLSLILICMLAATASADFGPKPSVIVDFEGVEGDHYYATLLSERDSTGPWSKSRDPYGDAQIWNQFDSYQDVDGFYFLGYFSDCTGLDEFQWTYYPPNTFKILLYFPGSDRFVVSAESYQRYAFDSYYTANVTDSGIQARTSYDYTWELLSLIFRILATIAVEMAIAWLFGFRAPKQVFIIGITNLATQVLLNVLLNIVRYQDGAFAFVFHYIWMELVVFVVEGCVYGKLLSRYETKPRRIHPWLYALTANVVSFVIGLLAALLVPGIF